MRNGCDRLGTLTYAPEHLPDDWAGVWEDVKRFRKRLAKITGEAIPIVAAIERGGKLGRLHVHLALGRYVAKEDLAAAWSRGFVEVRKLRIAGTGKRERCRRAAAYISKYVTKAYADGESGPSDRAFNGKRYSVTEGFSPDTVSRSVASFHHGMVEAQAICGGSVVWAWSSSHDPDWPGPPVTVVHFGDDDPPIYREDPP